MKNEKGLTLIELVVSVAVLSILIVPFFGIFTNAAKLDIRSKNEMTASYLAQQIVAEAKNNLAIFDEDEDDNWTTNDDATKYTTDSLSYLGSDFSKFSASITVEQPTNLLFSSGGSSEDFIPDDCEAVLIVTWREDINPNTKRIDYEGSPNGTTGDFEDNASDFEIILMDDEGEENYELVAKIDNNNPNKENTTLFTLKINGVVANTTIAVIVSDDSQVDNPRTITIDNQTGKNNNPTINIDAFTNTHEFITIVGKGNEGGVTMNNVFAQPSLDTSLSMIRIEITGYDPISKTNKVLSKIVTIVPNES